MSIDFQLLGDGAFINGTEICAPFIVKNGAQVVAVQLRCQHSDIVQVEFQQVLVDALTQRETRIGNGMHIKRDT